jgi:superfamily I DNA/RNA helicase
VLQTQFNPFIGYEHWLELLTEKQKMFVLAELDAPHKIEGPAGTGKTLCLVLKAIAELRKAALNGTDHRALFITHSDATRRAIQQLIETNDPDRFLEGEANIRPQRLYLTTLQQLCGNLLRQEISETEFLDRDALESKQLQALYVEEAFNAVMTTDYATYKPLLSVAFAEFLESTDPSAVVEMVQHEISVVIKGRADEKLDNYRKLPRLKYGLPTEVSADRGLVWTVFTKYQSQLLSAAQFDTDDIVITTIGQLDTPIWRRRRRREGYDSIFIDETHLFNMNELSMFHHLTRSEERFPIVFSVDRSQSVGDRGWTDELFEEALSPNAEIAARTEFRGIFRCSRDIVDLAFSVTSSGATLFTNFQNPLEMASSIMFTSPEELRCAPPTLLTVASDTEMVRDAYACSEELMRELGASKSTVAIIAFSDELFKQAVKHAEGEGLPVEIIKRRGDTEAVRRAQRSRRCVLSTPDYVGGLEFDGVILIGVDDGRVPPAKTKESIESSNFLSYASHNRLYVAITRARYRVVILALRERGPSPLLRNALASKILTLIPD